MDVKMQHMQRLHTRIWSITWVIFFIFILTLAVPQLHADTIILAGDGTMAYDIEDGCGYIRIFSYHSPCYRQLVVSHGEVQKKIRVITKLPDQPLPGLFPVDLQTVTSILHKYLNPAPAIQCTSKEIRKISKILTRHCGTVQESVDRVIEFIRGNITYDAETPNSQGAIETLDRKAGNCVGYSNLAIALLRAAGIPSRSMHGFLYLETTNKHHESTGDQKLRVGNYHRWIEVFYPGFGWVPSDPIISKNFVFPDHVLIQVDSNENPTFSSETLYQDIDLNQVLRLSNKKLNFKQVESYALPEMTFYSILCNTPNMKTKPSSSGSLGSKNDLIKFQGMN